MSCDSIAPVRICSWKYGLKLRDIVTWCCHLLPCRLSVSQSVRSYSIPNDVSVCLWYSLFLVLPDCLSHFCDMEELTESEQYLCESCRQHQRSTKKFYLRDLPPVRWDGVHGACASLFECLKDSWSSRWIASRSLAKSFCVP